jgi:hypothetical protein
MVRQEGVEPPTSWFVARHSIQLSYWRTKNAYYQDETLGRQHVSAVFRSIPITFRQVGANFRRTEQKN